MSPMQHKGVFEPKDPRVINMYEDDGDDEEELEFLSLTSASDTTPQPRRKKTGTQALAEFLITTSPEEFQKSPPKRSSNPFFRRRNKNKPPSSSNSTPTLAAYRSSLTSNGTTAKHVELVPTNLIQGSSMSTVSLNRIGNRTPSMGSKTPSVLRRSLMSNSDSQSPILPSNRNSKVRESSLYSDSLRYSLSARSQTSINTNNNNNNYHYFMSMRSQQSFLKRHDTDVSLAAAGPVTQRLDEQEEDTQGREAKATKVLVDHYASRPAEEFDVIERALSQRLERFRQSHMNVPSDAVTADLAIEHIRALEASNQAQHEQSSTATEIALYEKKKVRHMQVQTMPIDDNHLQDDRHTGAGDTLVGKKQIVTAMVDQGGGMVQTNLIEKLQTQLAEETLQRKRLQAALDETCDHFETLSGLAYKRLRELWEEKMYWENTCIELRERTLEMSKRDDANTEFAESAI
ncbi:hypothetical protein BX666DRAFT_1989337 [Dichotomocladium elegans]|nr:hypothetical protein BX666DRAFT_1989337 [Dichotomocladium elegans]